MTDELDGSGYEIVILNDGSKIYVCKLCIGIAWNTDNVEDIKNHVTIHQELTS